MAQFLRPASDVSAGAWLPSTGGSLFGTIDESSASDADYDYTESESAFEVALSTGTDPSLSTGHIVRYRAAGDGALDLVVTLKQGTTQIAQWTETAASASFTDYSHTLSGGEADAITDYTALRLHFEVMSAAGASFVDTFTRAAADLTGSTSSDGLFQWVEDFGGEWETNGTEAISLNIVDATYSVEWTNTDVNTDNYYVEADMSVFSKASGTSLYFQIQCRGAGGLGEGYYFSIGRTGGGAGTLDNSIKRVNDDGVVDTDTTEDCATGTIRLECNGTTIRALHNGVEFMSGTDATWSGGTGKRRAGIGSYAGGTSANDVAISEFRYGDL